MVEVCARARVGACLHMRGVELFRNFYLLISPVLCRRPTLF